MRAFLRSRPSPALIVASAALLIALSDVSRATVAGLIPRNSVGTAQLKPDAVTSAKIKNGAVALSDLTPAARLPGPAGPAGPAGAAGPTGPAGAQGAMGPAGAVTKLWAVTSASGSLSRSSGTTSAGRLGLGDYEVIFNQNVTNCVYVASIGNSAGQIGGPSSGFVATRPLPGNANGVEVATYSPTGAAGDRSFHLIVVC